MDPTQFTHAPGKLEPITLKEQRIRSGAPELIDVPTYAFIPNPLPPHLDWRELKVSLFEKHSEALLALGKLNGLHKRLDDAKSLLRTLWMREAKLSSEIEDIHTTAEEMVLAGASRSLPVRSVGQESWNYVLALEQGVASNLPFSTRLIREMHETLLGGVRGQDKRPGHFRQSPVFIGDPRKGPGAARFIPPPHDYVVPALESLQTFVNTIHPDIPPLFVVALAHYQFEAIHPFRDGNGRIGRVLISRSLVKEGLLDHPVVYMSSYIYQHRSDYNNLLLEVSTKGHWTEWIEFIIDAITTQAHDSIIRSECLIDLREDFYNRAKQKNASTRIFTLIDSLFNLPVINAEEAEKTTGVTRPTAYKDLALLQSLGILNEITEHKRNRDWVAPEILHIIEADDIVGTEEQ